MNKKCLFFLLTITISAVLVQSVACARRVHAPIDVVFNEKFEMALQSLLSEAEHNDQTEADLWQEQLERTYGWKIAGGVRPRNYSTLHKQFGRSLKDGNRQLSTPTMSLLAAVYISAAGKKRLSVRSKVGIGLAVTVAIAIAAGGAFWRFKGLKRSRERALNQLTTEKGAAADEHLVSHTAGGGGPSPSGVPVVSIAPGPSTGDVNCLKCAIEKSDNTTVADLLESHPALIDQGVLCGQYSVLPPLYYAILIDKSDTDSPIIQALLDRGAKMWESTMDGKTALFLAVHKNKTALVLQLLRALEGTSDTALLNKKYTSGESYYSATCLHLAAEKNNPQIVEALLGAGASINELDVYGKTALCVAAEQGNTEIVRMLLARGADIYAPRDRLNCSTLNIVSSRCYLSEDTAQNAEQRPIIQKLIRDQQRALQ